MNGSDKGRKSFQALNEKTHKSNKRFGESFYLPTLVEEPLLNLLAYGSVLGFAAKSLGLIPFDIVNLDLKDLKRRKRLFFPILFIHFEKVYTLQLKLRAINKIIFHIY